MDSPNTEANSSAGVVDYYSRVKPKRATSRLVALAPDVLVLARCEGAPEAALYFEKRFECKVTERMIKTIKAKVAQKKILVTREELEKAALSHQITAARMAREPSICDPDYYFSAVAPKPEGKKIDQKSSNQASVKRAVKKSAGVAAPTVKEMDVRSKIGKDSQLKASAFIGKNDMQLGFPTGKTADDLSSPREMEKINALLNADDEEDALLYS